MLSRIFFSMIAFHCIFPHHSVEKCYKTRSRFLRKNQHFFREINFFTIEVAKDLISRNLFCMIAFCRTFPHCTVHTPVIQQLDLTEKFVKLQTTTWFAHNLTENFLKSKYMCTTCTMHMHRDWHLIWRKSKIRTVLQLDLHFNWQKTGGE